MIFRRPLPVLISLIFLALIGEQSNAGEEPRGLASRAATGFIAIPNRTNSVQLRLYTNAAPEAEYLFNTFEIEAYGETLLRAPMRRSGDRWSANCAECLPHHFLVNGEGPAMAAGHSMKIIEETAGPGWRYMAVDLTSAYNTQLKTFKRGILFVEPDLFVIYDEAVAREPSSFRMVLHPPATASVDWVWHDLRLQLTNAGMRVHAPAPQRILREWVHVESKTDQIFPGTVTMELGPTNKVARLDLLTAFAIHRGSEKKELAFRLLQGVNAIGARIHRDGLPVLVAFKIDTAAGKGSLTGFEFDGPAAVDVYRPKTLEKKLR